MEQLVGDEKSVLETVKLLGFDLKEFTTWDVDTIYAKCYGIQLDNIKESMFANAEIDEFKEYRRNC